MATFGSVDVHWHWAGWRSFRRVPLRHGERGRWLYCIGPLRVFTPMRSAGR